MSRNVIEAWTHTNFPDKSDFKETRPVPAFGWFKNIECDRKQLYNYKYNCFLIVICVFLCIVRAQALGPAARNHPNIVRRDPDLPPSVVHQDYPFEDPTGEIQLW